MIYSCNRCGLEFFQKKDIQKHLNNKLICMPIKSDIDPLEQIKDFPEEYSIGFLLILDNDNFEKIVKIEKEIVPNQQKFYLIYVKHEFETKLLYFLIENKINNIKIVIYNESENLDYTYITNKHKESIEDNSDFFYNSNQLETDYVFYTIIYNIKSKFEFSNYINWGKNLLKFITNYKLIIFTNESTLDILKNQLNLNHPNISIIIKNLNELEYQCDDIFLKNTSSKYFPGLDLSSELIKIWINRHLLVKDVQKIIYSNHYCYIDWGYIRDDSGSNIIFDNTNINNHKIYIGVIHTNINYLQNILDNIKDFNKDNIEETLVKMLVSVCGGFTLIPYNKVSYWYYIFKLYFNKFISKNIDFKDDQTIIRQILFDQTERVNFNLITDYNTVNWFPFIKFLQKNDNQTIYKTNNHKNINMETLILYQSPFIKKRIGKDNDGGYVISMLPNSYDLFISSGISNDISFESNFLDLYPDIRCYAFDGTISSLPAQHNRITFFKKNLGYCNSDTLTNLHEYIENYDNIFMKIDIEGHEFKIMPTIIKNKLMKKIKQFLIEVHTPADINMFPEYFKGVSDINNNDMFNLFNEINNTHTLVHFHANNGSKIQKIDGITLPHVFELTYIRNDFFNKKEKNIESLPTSLDMKNIPENDDYKLEGFPYSFRAL